MLRVSLRSGDGRAPRRGAASRALLARCALSAPFDRPVSLGSGGGPLSAIPARGLFWSPPCAASESCPARHFGSAVPLPQGTPPAARAAVRRMRPRLRDPLSLACALAALSLLLLLFVFLVLARAEVLFSSVIPRLPEKQCLVTNRRLRDSLWGTRHPSSCAFICLLTFS